MKIIAGGSRAWRDRGLIRATLAERGARVAADAVARDARGERLVVVHGHAPEGADKILDREARDLGWSVVRMPVDKALDGEWPGAGPARTRRMLRDHADADCVVAFNLGTAGTTELVESALRAGFSVMEWRIDPLRRVMHEPQGALFG